MDLKDLLAGGGGLLGLGGFWAWLGTRAKRPVDMVTAQASFQTALNETQKTFSSTMQELLRFQNREIQELREDIIRLTKAEQECRSENAKQYQRIISLENILRREGTLHIPEAKRTDALFVELDNGAVTEYIMPSEFPND